MPHLTQLPKLPLGPTALVLMATFGALAPSSARADGVPLGMKAGKLDVAMTADGAAHVATLAPGPGKPVLRVCRIPAGDVTCTPTGTATLPNDSATGPFVVARGNQVTVAAGNAGGAEEGTVAMTAPTGVGYGAPKRVAPITASDVELSPGGDRLWISSSHGPTGAAHDFAAFSSAPLPSGAPGGAATIGTAAGGRSLSGPIAGVRPDGRPLISLQGSGPGLSGGTYAYAFDGPATTDAALNDKATWGAPTRVNLPEPSAQNGDHELASAPGRLWLAYEALGTDVLLRQWEGSGFGPALSPDCRRPSRFSSGSQQAPALALSRTGDLLLAYVGSDGTRKHLGYFRGSPDGSRFSAYREIHTGPDDQEDVEIASDPTSDTGGIVVWTSDAVYADKGELKFARLPEAPLADCPAPTPPAAPPVSSPPVKPTVLKPRVAAPGLASLVRGLPATKRCVSRRRFTIRLRHPAGTRISSATVKVNGRTVATRKGKRVTAAVSLRGLPKGRYKVTIAVRLADGRTVKGTRRYRTCAPKRRR